MTVTAVLDAPLCASCGEAIDTTLGYYERDGVLWHFECPTPLFDD